MLVARCPFDPVPVLGDLGADAINFVADVHAIGHSAFVGQRSRRCGLLQPRKFSPAATSVLLCHPWNQYATPMNILATLSVTDLNEVLKLRQEAETIKDRLAEIDAALAAFAEGKAAVPVPTAVVPPATAVPEAPTATAASVEEPAEPKKRKRSMSPAARAAISASRKAWWATKKGNTAATTPSAKPAKVGSPKRGKRGAVKEAIIGLVKNCGKEGISVADVARKLKSTPKRVYMWFSSTGKAIKEIKKVAPAKYAWVR